MTIRKTTVKKITITITYKPEEKVKAIAYCYDNAYDITNMIDKGIIIAQKEEEV